MYLYSYFIFVMLCIKTNLIQHTSIFFPVSTFLMTLLKPFDIYLLSKIPGDYTVRKNLLRPLSFQILCKNLTNFSTWNTVPFNILYFDKELDPEILFKSCFQVMTYYLPKLQKLTRLCTILVLLRLLEMIFITRMKHFGSAEQS